VRAILMQTRRCNNQTLTGEPPLHRARNLGSVAVPSTTRLYENALDDALSHLKSLLGSTSNSWRPVQPAVTSSDLSAKGKARELVNGIGVVDPSAVLVHRRSVKGKPDILRAVVDVPVNESVDPDNFKAVLQTPEVSAACELYSCALLELPLTRDL
jgi:hypothetical protein